MKEEIMSVKDKVIIMGASSGELQRRLANHGSKFAVRAITEGLRLQLFLQVLFAQHYSIQLMILKIVKLKLKLKK
jgi:hypothetical protein